MPERMRWSFCNAVRTIKLTSDGDLQVDCRRRVQLIGLHAVANADICGVSTAMSRGRIVFGITHASAGDTRMEV
jgi:hypothetical protein